MSLTVWKKEADELDDRDITRVLRNAGPAQHVPGTAEQFGERKLQKRAARDIVFDIDQNDLELRHNEERRKELETRAVELRAELGDSLNAIDELTGRYRDQYLGKPDDKQAEKADGQDGAKRKKR